VVAIIFYKCKNNIGTLKIKYNFWRTIQIFYLKFIVYFLYTNIAYSDLNVSIYIYMIIYIYI